MRLKYFAGGVLKLKGGKKSQWNFSESANGGFSFPVSAAVYRPTSQTPPGEQERSSKSTDSVADVGVC